MIDPFWERVYWFVLVSAIAGIGWLARSILKPWSDAALMRSKAFTDLVKVLETSIPSIKEELDVLKNASAASNLALGRNTVAAQEQTKALANLEPALIKLNKMPSDLVERLNTLCKAQACAVLTKPIPDELIEMVAKRHNVSPEEVRKMVGELSPAT